MTLRPTNAPYPLARDGSSGRLLSSAAPTFGSEPPAGSPQGPPLEDSSRRLAYPPLNRQVPSLAPATTTSSSFPYGLHGQPMRQGYFDHGHNYQGLVSDDRLLLQPPLSTSPQASGLAVSSVPLNSVDSSGTWGMGMHSSVMLPSGSALAPSDDMSRRNLQVPVESMYRRQPLDANGAILDTRSSSLEGVPGYDSTPGLRSSFSTSTTTGTSPSDDSSKATVTTAGKTDSTALTDPSPSSVSAAPEPGSTSALTNTNGNGTGTTPTSSRKSITPGPVTVGDIVSRPIHERRKRPIPQNPEKLVQLDAPIPPRRKMFKAPANEKPEDGEEEVGIQLQRGSKRKYKASETVGDAEAKRIRNTLAARRHRLYKAAQWRDMLAQVEQLQLRNQELEAMLRNGDMARICAENAKLLEQVYSLEYERHVLLARLGGHDMPRMDEPRRDMPY